MRSKAAIPVALFVALVAAAMLSPGARAGHEFPYYPSYYPQEIRLETATPERAARLLQNGALHAFIGGDPYRSGKAPDGVSRVEFLGSYLVATLDGPSVAQLDRDGRCALVGQTLRVLSMSRGGYAFHPYPVTPYHADYLHHFDRIESLKSRYAGGPVQSGDSAGPQPILRAKGALATKLVGRPSRPRGAAWDATIEDVDIDVLMSKRAIRFDGWFGPPWIKEGWFQAYLLLADRIRDRAARLNADALVQRLIQGDHRTPEEKLTIERRLVALLTDNCEAMVVGYTVKREYFNTGFSTGVENVAFDSHSGLNSPMFIRTAKLKDFPWNGWLRLGIADRPAAAWNPIGGFTDPFGRLMWAAMGDPALLPAPHSASWITNRVVVSPAEEQGRLARLRSWFSERLGRAGQIGVPRDALLPEPESGLLRRAGPGQRARAKMVYRVLTSSFHDGTPMGVGDVLYPYVMAYKWGGDERQERVEHDGHIEKSTALLRARLVGFRVARVDKEVMTIGDIRQTWLNPVVEAYLSTASIDLQQVASVAPPWASVPWHVMVLMEEAAKRRMAAFSEEEARRRSVEWLDLVRRPALKKRLAGLVEELRARAYIPEALRGFVTVEEARQRWQALTKFYQKHGHFLVTNGPYRLEKWTEDSVVLSVFRDLSYPRGIGFFDNYPVPRRGYITALNVKNGRLHVQAEVELVEKFARSYRIVREPLTNALLPGRLNKVRPVCRYVAISPDGRVVKAGTASYAGDGAFAVDLTAELTSLSTILAAVYVDESSILPPVRMLRLGPQ